MTKARLNNFHPDQIAIIRNRAHINALARAHSVNSNAVGTLVFIDNDDCYEMWYTKTSQPRPNTEVHYIKPVRAATYNRAQLLRFV